MPSRLGATSDARWLVRIVPLVARWQVRVLTLVAWWLVRILVLVAAAGLGLVAVATEASAHPVGPPPVAKVVADGTKVIVTWSAADDDLIALGVRTGALPRSSAAPDDPAVRAAVAESAAAYLGNHLSVAQGNQTCRLSEAATTALWDGGARLEFTCPGEVTEVSLRITALTDIDPAYRTVSVSTSGAGALHTATAPAHAIELTGKPTDKATVGKAGSEVVLVAAGVGMALVLAGVGLAVLRRRASKVPPPKSNTT